MIYSINLIFEKVFEKNALQSRFYSNMGINFGSKQSFQKKKKIALE